MCNKGVWWVGVYCGKMYDSTKKGICTLFAPHIKQDLQKNLHNVAGEREDV